MNTTIYIKPYEYEIIFDRTPTDIYYILFNGEGYN